MPHVRPGPVSLQLASTCVSRPLPPAPRSDRSRHGPPSLPLALQRPGFVHPNHAILTPHTPALLLTCLDIAIRAGAQHSRGPRLPSPNHAALLPSTPVPILTCRDMAVRARPMYLPARGGTGPRLLRVHPGGHGAEEEEAVVAWAFLVELGQPTGEPHEAAPPAPPAAALAAQSAAAAEGAAGASAAASPQAVSPIPPPPPPPSRLAAPAALAGPSP